MENWKDIEGYEGLYQVSDEGRVRSVDRIIKKKNGFDYVIKGQVLKQGIGANGYPLVVLSKHGITKSSVVHILVARAFPEICGEWFEGATVNHKDECRNNNFASNLEYCTQSFNNTWGTRIEKWIDSRSIPVKQILNGKVIKVWKSAKEVQRAGIVNNSSQITRTCRGQGKTAAGFEWQYV